jgi:hypothetical protein
MLFHDDLIVFSVEEEEFHVVFDGGDSLDSLVYFLEIFMGGYFVEIVEEIFEVVVVILFYMFL